MATGDNSNPAIYGPVDGRYVTLAEFQAWQAAEYARNQAAASVAFDAAAKAAGFDVPNPYTVPATPKPAGTSSATTPAAHTTFSPHAIDGADPFSYCDIYWDDPLCSIWGGGGIYSPGGGGTVIEQPIIIQQGLGSTEVNALVDGGLRSVWATVVGTVDAAIATIVREIQTALTGQGNAIKAAYGIMARLGGFILNALTTLLRGTLAGIIKALNDIRDVLKHLWDDVLKPLAKAAQAFRDRLLEIYKKWIRPLIVIIQDIRRVLGLLAAFHVPFAAKLDRKLGELERRITAPFLLLLQYTNAVANWVNLIITAGYLLRQSVFLNTAKAYAGSLIGLQVAAINQPPSPADVAAGRKSLTAPTSQQTITDTRQFLQTGTGALSGHVTDATQFFNQILNGGTPQ